MARWVLDDVTEPGLDPRDWDEERTQLMDSLNPDDWDELKTKVDDDVDLPTAEVLRNDDATAEVEKWSMVPTGQRLGVPIPQQGPPASPELPWSAVALLAGATWTVAVFGAGIFLGLSL